MNEPQLSVILPATSPQVVLNEAQRIFAFHYPADAFAPVSRLFGLAADLFEGRFPGYRRCNTEYHNLAHTVDTFLAVIRIVDGFNLTEGSFDATTAVRLLSAALFHDSGYIQKDWDTLGTGAKYTREHVTRSKEFIVENAAALGLSREDVSVISRYVDSTETAPILKRDSGASLAERTAAPLLGAADLVAQMSDRVYLEKLLFLYYEFREAEIDGYGTEYDVIRHTLEFYDVVNSRLEKDYGGVHLYTRRHFNERFDVDRDLYGEAIESNMEYVRAIMDDPKSNFRAKLKRTTG
ncbi:MAG: hypothetical protein JXD23_16415 [Spirochaetales bacterium]|nr:hypothetical protein [Spirochaetales bacterium]